MKKPSKQQRLPASKQRLRIEYMELDWLRARYWPGNAKEHDLEELAAAYADRGFVEPIIFDDTTGKVVAGHGRLDELDALRLAGEPPPHRIEVHKGKWFIPVVRGIGFKDEAQAGRHVLASNRLVEIGGWDNSLLVAQLAKYGGDAAALAGTGFTTDDYAHFMTLAKAGADAKAGQGQLQERFLVPPFSVLDARQGYWQDRKRAWLSLGIQSELGRTSPIGGAPMPLDRQQAKLSTALTGDRASSPADGQVGASVFDPVLCELAYLWFSPARGRVIDPFAGGSVRGIVAGTIGRQYVGVDLRREQIAANVHQAKTIKPKRAPMWIEGDSRQIDALVTGQFDFMFTCPPYGDLEVYSDSPADLSTMSYTMFIKELPAIFGATLKLLRKDRFAAVVVGDFRDEKGMYRNFVGDTISAMLHAGAKLYNEAILVTAVGSLPIRTSAQFPTSRKLGKSHQNVLVFVKGDPLKAVEACGPVAVPDLASSDAALD